MTVVIYLLGVVISMFMLFKLWAKLETKLTVLSIVCGLLSTLTSWLCVMMLTLVFIKVKEGNKKNNDITII
jgi:hypothetical protein